MILPKKIQSLEPYQPIQGDYDIRLDANESPYAYPLDYKAIEESINRYPDPYAIDLCRAFADYYNVDYNYVTAFNGSDESIALVVSTLFDSGDKIVTLSNDFSMYNFYVNVYGMTGDVYQKNADLEVEVDDLIAYVKDSGAKGLIFSNPCNPTSLLIGRDDIIKICEQLTECLVVVDEAYMDFAEQTIIDISTDYDNVILMRTCSKAIGLAGVRLGFCVADEMLTKALKSAKSPYNVNAISQKIGTVVLSDKQYLYEKKCSLVEQTKILQTELENLNFGTVYKSHTNFVFIKTDRATEIYEGLLEQSIAVRYMGDYIRITTGTTEQNLVLLGKLKEIVC